MKMGNLDLNLCTFLCIMMLSSFVACQNSANDIDDNELGMGILYDMVHVFLEDVVHTKHISDSFLNLSRLFIDGEFQEDEVNQPEEWAEYLIGFAVCVAIGIVFILAMPIAGIIICCCRSCGKCGGKSHKQASKRAKCKRRTYCTILLILNTVALAGIICAFISNSLLYKHLQDDDDQGSVGHVKQSLKSVELLVNTSVDGGSEYVIREFDVTSAEILTMVNDSASNAVDKVLKELNTKELVNQALRISKDANNTAEELHKISDLLSALSNESETLKQNLTEIKTDVDTACKSGVPDDCRGFDPNQYDTNADFSSLDRLSSESDRVAESLDMYEYVVEANATLNKVVNDAKGQVMDKTQEASDAVNDVKLQILRGVDNLKNEKENALSDLPSIYADLDDADDNIKKYSEYGYYGGIGVCCVYLLIIVLYYIGILYGMCGERPGHDAPCCNTGCGANFLIAGVAFTFIFSWLLMIICVVLFAAGGPTQTEVCRYFMDHDPSKIEPFDQTIVEATKLRDLYKTPPKNLSVVEILQNCQRNQALFGALHLDHIVDLDDIMDIGSLEAQLEDLKTSTVTVEDIMIISTNLKDRLEKLANSGLESINFGPYFAELSKTLTMENLGDLANGVQAFASKPGTSADTASLQNSANRLRQLNNETLPALQKKVQELNNTLVSLQAQSTLKNSILALIDNLTSAQDEFNRDKETYIRGAIAKLGDDILDHTKVEINKVKTDIRENLFGCQNLTTAMFTATDSVCILVVDPVNGLWFSFGWCLFFFVPCLIFALLLAGQYRIEHDYDKEFDDPHNMMYAGPNQDTIPLTSLEQAGRSGHHNRQSDPYGMSNAGYRDDRKRVPSYAAPPPYEDHMHPGIAAYAPSHQHHDLAQAYPALHGEGSYPASNGTKSTAYSYPY